MDVLCEMIPKASAEQSKGERRRIYRGENGADSDDGDDIKEEIPAKIDLASKSR